MYRATNFDKINNPKIFNCIVCQKYFKALKIGLKKLKPIKATSYIIINYSGICTIHYLLYALLLVFFYLIVKI